MPLVLPPFFHSRPNKHAALCDCVVVAPAAVSKKGEKPIDGITKLNPDGLTVTTGTLNEVWKGCR